MPSRIGGIQMGGFLGSFVLPLLLLAAALLDWNLISTVNILFFFSIRFATPETGFSSQKLVPITCCIIIFSILVILVQVIFHILWCIEGERWNVANSYWAKLIGLVRDQPWRITSVIYFVTIQLAAAFVALVDVLCDRQHLHSPWVDFTLATKSIDYHLRVLCCLLLPSVQLVLGISNPSWISLPFFICSCVGLTDWSLTSNFLGLFRWWRPLLLYACFSILLIYIYQLPVDFPNMFLVFADFIGLYKINKWSDWPELCSGTSLLLYFFMLSSVKYDLQEMDSIMSMKNSSLVEQLLPQRHSFFIQKSRSGRRHANVLLRISVFRTFTINFFTYGFPALLLSLSIWSFNFTSLCSFGLLAYVGFVLFAFPSLVQLHRLNEMLLIFILLWAASTYVFNVAFTFLNKRIQKDMMIWETIGLWHYPIPGLFLLAQFVLGGLLALVNLVNNSVFLYLSDEDGRLFNNDKRGEEKEDTKVLIVATIAWGVRKISGVITLVLLFLLLAKPGLVHAAYSMVGQITMWYPNNVAEFIGITIILLIMCFFLVFLLRHSPSRKMRQALIIFCEAHFLILYILQLDLISEALQHSGSRILVILSQLGLQQRVSHMAFVELGVLVCFCAFQNHGVEMLCSFSTILQRTPCTPLGFSILKDGLKRSVLLSIYNSSSSSDHHCFYTSHEQKIATYLRKIGEKFLSTYHSYGTHVAFLTILCTVYMATPNYISFGYLFFLLVWLVGRQLLGKTERRFWFPLKVYATLVFIFNYSLSISSNFASWLSKLVDLYPDLGFNPKASLLENVWESLAVLIVMQLYSYERSQRRYKTDESSDISEFSFLGFMRRFLIWHSEKILSVAIFYAALSSIGAFGLVYLLGLILCSILPKASRIPSKIFLVYTGFLVMSEYLFQMWCKLAEMCPDQRFNSLAFFLGYKYYDPGFWGIESGLRGKVLVIVACTLQYNVFHWLKNMPTSLIHKGKWEEPCQLFISVEYSSSCYAEDNKSLLYSTIADVNSSPSFVSKVSKTPVQILNLAKGSEHRIGKFSLDNFWGTSKESHKLNKRHILASKKERLEIQKTTLIIYMKFWMENLFKLRGLEIHMIVLLLSSFSVLNAISMIYILCIVTCILLKREVIRKLWPVFVFIFASILIVEYFAIWRDQFPWNYRTSIAEFHCCDCWSTSNQHFSFCTKCWLGVIVDDRRMLVSYYLVFIFSSFKLRSDRFSDFSESNTYYQMMSQRRSVLVWKDLSFETKSFWTFLDYLRLYCYCHLLDIVLALILIIGTLEYDVLHLGYLAFALVFFRMRLEILKKKNMIFKYLRIYNFTVIVLSLAYQSPYLGVFSTRKCEKIDYIYEVIGFHKYDYGFRITSRSALVEIIIFMLVSVQSYVFYSGEFDYVGRHLEAEQVSALLQEQQKRATRKIAELQHINNLEKENQQRNMQVEKIKSDMLNLQVQLSNQNPVQSPGNSTLQTEDLRHRRNFSLQTEIVDWLPDNVIRSPMRKDLDFSIESFRSFEYVPELCKNKKPHVYDIQSSPKTIKSRNSCFADVKRTPDSPREISDLGYAEGTLQWNTNRKENPLVSAVQLIGDGVSQVQSLGNQAVANIASLLNIEPEDLDSSGHYSSDDEIHEVKSQTAEYDYFEQMSSVHSGIASTSPSTSVQIERIFGFIWSQMRLNNDIVCYCCFVLVFLWNFSVLSMFYLAALFLYALCVNSGPTFSFWLIMLVYTEVNILLQYLYQIVIQHCALSINLPILQKLGFPLQRIKASFVISTLPLFLVYIFTLLQSSITAKDAEWAPVTEFRYSMQKIHDEKSSSFSNGWKAVVQKSLSSLSNPLKLISRSSSRYWRSITQGSEAPPYFIQISMEISQWPDDGAKLEMIESGINELLTIAHEKRCDAENPSSCHSASRVQIQSIERSQENENIAIAILEVIYACPLIGCAPVEWYRSLTPAADVAAEILNSQASMIFKEIHFPYPIVSIIGGGKKVVDLSAYIFGVDLAVFFLVAIFYQSVIKNSTKFLDVYQLEDQFPKEFVFILMVLFFLIVLDRIIYLFSFGISRVIFYIFNLLLFTYSVTEYAWCMEPSHKRLELALRVIYLMKSVSLALHALQIRYGIPNKGTLYRQFLTSKVTQIHYMGFRLYRAIPFLYELRCVLDWSCTVTSLTMYDWLKLEDIYASLFLVKCDAHLNRSKHKQGERQCKMTKFCSGICLFLILICVIWAPMLIYSSGNPINIANPVIDASIEIDMKSAGGRLPLYKSSICEKSPWRSSEFYDELVPDHYLDTYDVEDMQLICCQADASTAWIVPSVVQNRYASSIDQNTSIMFTWIFTRERPKGKEVVKYESFVENCSCLNDVKQVLNGTAASFRTRDAYPKYFHVTSSGEVRALEPVVASVSGDLYLNHHGNPPWWSFSNIGASDVEGCNGLAGPMAIVISEETPQGILGETISKFSIWSIYITFVLAVGRFIRLQCSDLRMRIPYENLPSCDRLVAICENIYAARAEGELEVEEILYWTLIKIYRSPHMLFEYTTTD